jgi:hypothetical protein
MARPTALTFNGEMIPITWDESGEAIAFGPDRFFSGVPARDLDEEDIARLDDATLASITGGETPLYSEGGAGTLAAKTSKTSAKTNDAPPPAEEPAATT